MIIASNLGTSFRILKPEGWLNTLIGTLFY